MEYSNKERQEIFSLLNDTFDNIQSLYAALGIAADIQTQYPSNQLLYFLESVINRGAVLSNVKAINKNLKKAAQKSAELGAHSYALEREQAELEEENKDLRAEIAQLRQEQALRQQVEGKLVEVKKEHQKQQIEQLMAFISFRDGLIMREGLAKDQNAAEYMRLFSGLLVESANTLNKCGVTILEQKGKFDETFQIITQTEPTAQKALHQEIAEVFRPGYKLGDLVLRPEEVIIYSSEVEK